MPDPLAKSSYRRFRDANTNWLRRYGALLLISAFVLSLGGASALVLVRFASGVSSYRSPLAKYPAAGDPTEPVVPQVVLVVVDGLREDASRSMPTLERLRAQGASATVSVPFPSPQTALTTLLTGATAEINDAVLVETGASHIRPIGLESLFTTVRHANLNAALATQARWQDLVPSQLLSESYFAQDEDPAVVDRRANDTAISFLSNFAPNFLLVHYSLPDTTAQRYGATGEEYRQAVFHTDQLLAQLIAAMDLRQAVVVVTSSYGQADRGGHTGSEPAVNRVPLVLSGMHIKPGEYGAVCQCDIAPTIAALVGGSIPSVSQGAVLFYLLDLDDMQRAVKALAESQQQREYGLSYLAAVGGTLSEAALNDPPVARSSFEVKNYPSAFTLASLAVLEVQHDTDAARSARIEKERLARVPFTILLIALPLLLFWFRRSLQLAGSALIALGIISMLHWQYLYTHHTYSFSDIVSIEQSARGFAERTIIALLFGGLLVTIYHWRDPKPSRPKVARTLLLASICAIYLTSLPFAFGYFVNGLGPQWYLGSLTWAFVEVFSLSSIVFISAIAVPAAAVVALVYWLALIILHRLALRRWFSWLTLRFKQANNP
jgi:Type I phosphodiesterase / nucleotide pyrophosphatase